MTEQQPLVSIITPVYNAEKLIVETMQSVLEQTYTNWEHLLIDDCSSDNSAEVIKDFSKNDPRIKLISLSENRGAAVARNVGLDKANGDYIAFIDSDDVWAITKLAKQVEFMQTAQLAFSYTDFAFINLSGELIKPSANIPLSLDYHGLLKNTAIACSTVMIDRKQIGNFHMPLVRKGQDTATWLMLMRKYQIKAYGLKKVLNFYRQVPGSISSNRFGALKRTWHTYHQIEELPLWEASYYFTQYVFHAIKRRL